MSLSMGSHLVAIPSYAVHPGALHAYRILGPGDQDLAPTNITGQGNSHQQDVFPTEHRHQKDRWKMTERQTMTK